MRATVYLATELPVHGQPNKKASWFGGDLGNDLHLSTHGVLLRLSQQSQTHESWQLVPWAQVRDVQLDGQPDIAFGQLVRN
jgi:hypothetical protein